MLPLVHALFAFLNYSALYLAEMMQKKLWPLRLGLSRLVGLLGGRLKALTQEAGVGEGSQPWEYSAVLLLRGWQLGLCWTCRGSVHLFPLTW